MQSLLTSCDIDILCHYIEALVILAPHPLRPLLMLINPWYSDLNHQNVKNW